MQQFLTDNIGNIIVIAIVAVLMFLAIRSMVKDKKNGKSSCGCNCSGCALSGTCHSRQKKD